MKKQLLAIALCTVALTQAQTWSENFNATSAPGLPAGWMQNNVDGLTVNSSLSAYNFGTNAWVTRNFTATDPQHASSAVSTSWYSSAGISNDWLITPSFTVPANAFLDFEAIALDASYPDGYLVKVSTTGTAVANFTTILTVAAENDTWTPHGLSLNAYAGQTVNIAFVNNSNDMYILLLDNVRVSVPPSNDGKVLSTNTNNRYMVGAGTQLISGDFVSGGYSPALNTVLNYNINGGAVNSQTFNFSSPGLNYGQTYAYAFTAAGNFSLGTNRVKTWVSKVNGINEVVTNNDTAYSYVYVASTSTQRNALVEEWTSSTCNPCASLNQSFDPLLSNNNPNTGGTLNVIKYQVNWPAPGNDPSYNAHALARVKHYNINFAPDGYANGTYEMNNFDQAELDAAKNDPAYADITATLSAFGSTNAAVGTTVIASSTIIPYVSIPANSPLRVHQVLLQNSYHYAASTTSQDDYHHVMRKMTGNGWGTPVNVTDGVAFTATFSNVFSAGAVDPSTPAQMSFNVWTNTLNPLAPKDIVYEYVVFVQDTISNDVLQSASWFATVSVPAATVSTVGLKESSNANALIVSPNPAQAFVQVSVQLNNSSDVKLSVYDMNGKLVYENKAGELPAGFNSIQINTADFAAGVYTIESETPQGQSRQKLVIQK